MPREWQPGYKTSEFWVTFAVILIAAGIGVFAIIFCHSEWSHIAGMGLGAVAVFKAHGYTLARTQLKKLWAQYLGTFGQSPNCDSTPIPAPIQHPLPQPVQPTQIIVPSIQYPEFIVTTKLIKGGGTTTTVKISPKKQDDQES